jgi:hypothetical protein
MLAYNITKDAISLVIEDQVYTVPRTSPQAAKIINQLRLQPVDEVEVARLVALEYSPEVYSDGRIKIMKGGTVEYNGAALPRALAQKVKDCYEDGVPFENVLKFFDRLNANPSKRATEELYTFLEHKGMPITPEGHFLAYKGIQTDGYSCTAGDRSKVIEGETNEDGRIRNFVGDKIRVTRNYVDDNKDVGCSSGLHAGSLEYATSFGPKHVIVKIDPADVVSIPTDCSCQKLRTCAYEVVADYKGKLQDSGVRDASRPYFEDLEEDDDGDIIGIVSIGIRCREPVQTGPDWDAVTARARELGRGHADDGYEPDTPDDLEGQFTDASGEGPEDWDDEFQAFKEAYYAAYRGQ